MNRYLLECKSNPKEIRKIETLFKRIKKDYFFDEGIMYRLLVACTEAVNNAIIHGNKLDRKKRVRVTCCVSRKEIVVRVKDNGSGFEPDKIPNPLEEQNLLKENGRGVFLIRSLMDEVNFKKLKTGAVVEMKIKRQ